MPARAIRAAIAASESATVAATLLRAILQQYETHQITVDQFRERATEPAADMLCASEHMRRAIIDFEVRKAEARANQDGKIL